MNLSVSRTSQRTISIPSILPALLIALMLASSPGLGGEERPDDQTIRYQSQKLSIRWDPLTRSPLIIRGIESNLLEIKNFPKLSRKEITQTGPPLVNKYKSLLQIEPDQLRLKGAEKISDTWYVSYWQTFHGMILYESSLGFSIDPRGDIKSLGAYLYPHVQVPDTSKVIREQALKIAQGQIKDFRERNCTLLAESVLIYPARTLNSINYYRVYAFNFFPEKALHPASVVGGWAVFIDTQTGKKVLYEELLKPLGCCIPPDWVPPKPGEMKPKW